LPRRVSRLSVPSVRAANKPGAYADGAGLYLRVSKWGTKSWGFRFSLDGKPRWMGLGSVNNVSLARARDKAHHCRTLLSEGIDPIDHRRAEKSRRRLEAARTTTFRELAEDYIARNKSGWSNEKHAAQWSSTLETYAHPVLGKLAVGEIETALVMRVLEPIWTSKPETAMRVRQRIEAILDAARVMGYREGENPARWRGHLDKLLPRREKVRRVKHHAAMPYPALPEFMQRLKGESSISASALRFLILTAARTTEVLLATWDEMDLEAGVWVIPADRMKARKEHRVPLSADAQDIIRAMRDLGRNGYVFLGSRKGAPLSNMTMLQFVRRMEPGSVTVHGFRSSFRDWAAERSSYPAEVAKMALAHAVGDKVEAAYRRGDLFEKRKRMMDDWARFCLEQRNVGLHQHAREPPSALSPQPVSHRTTRGRVMGYWPSAASEPH